MPQDYFTSLHPALFLDKIITTTHFDQIKTYESELLTTMLQDTAKVAQDVLMRMVIIFILRQLPMVLDQFFHAANDDFTSNENKVSVRVHDVCNIIVENCGLFVNVHDKSISINLSEDVIYKGTEVMNQTYSIHPYTRIEVETSSADEEARKLMHANSSEPFTFDVSSTFASPPTGTSSLSVPGASSSAATSSVIHDTVIPEDVPTPSIHSASTGINISQPSRESLTPLRHAMVEDYQYSDGQNTYTPSQLRDFQQDFYDVCSCLLYTSPSPRD